MDFVIKQLLSALNELSAKRAYDPDLVDEIVELVNALFTENNPSRG